MRTSDDAAAAVPEAQSWFPEYWLGHSEGFRVDSSDGDHVGFVEEVVRSQDGERVAALVVRRCRRAAGTTLTVAAERIAAVRPSASLIVVHGPPDELLAEELLGTVGRSRSS